MMDKIMQIKGYYPPRHIWPDLESTMKTEGNICFRMVEAENIYDAPAFFNPVMVLNRDFAILFAELYAIKNEIAIRVFEPLAGIGIRALRMATEIDRHIAEIIINDFGDISSKIAAYNIEELNLTGKIFQFKREARSLALDLAEHLMRYHFIDLDPFGPPVSFIDSMWTVMPRRSMIAVTATDMQALCGVFPDACYRKYGGIPLNNHHTHETAARIMIAMVARSAARFERGVQPIFTSAVDHYTKVFFLTKMQRGAANESVANIGYSYTCQQCAEIHYIAGDAVDQHCCGQLSIRAGPLWTGKIFDSTWCSEALNLLEKKELPSQRRMQKLLQEGVDAEKLFGYYAMDERGKTMRITLPNFKELHQELTARGYACIKTRFTKNAIRSDVPGTELQEIIELLVRQKNI
ncbi:MAG: hypothetical protein INQ03_04620 [Candidatus Heimdallarchaeota archaeon]|nr:hypothetical protein [Candidatus Heimdallarchaeota archaeon]